MNWKSNFETTQNHTRSAAQISLTSLEPTPSISSLSIFSFSSSSTLVTATMRIHQTSLSVLVTLCSILYLTPVEAVVNAYGAALYPIIDMAILQRRAALQLLATQSAINDLRLRAASALVASAIPNNANDIDAWRQQKTPTATDVPTVTAEGIANVQFLVCASLSYFRIY